MELNSLDTLESVNVLCERLRTIPLEALRAIQDLPPALPVSAVNAVQKNLLHKARLPVEHAGLIVSALLKIRKLTPG